MPKRSRKPADLNRLAASILEEATDPDFDPYRGKNPAAVELGRLGGKKGGTARAAKLSPEERREIARKTAAARWRPHKGLANPYPRAPAMAAGVADYVWPVDEIVGLLG
ncbi:MAG: hypothetical protein ACREOD_08070 [Candidatus Dormibacteria bacterium]